MCQIFSTSYALATSAVWGLRMVFVLESVHSELMTILESSEPYRVEDRMDAQFNFLRTWAKMNATRFLIAYIGCCLLMSIFAQVLTSRPSSLWHHISLSETVWSKCRSFVHAKILYSVLPRVCTIWLHYLKEEATLVEKTWQGHDMGHDQDTS